LITQAAQRPGGTVSDWHPAISLAEYEQAVDRIKHDLADGHSYLINYLINSVRRWQNAILADENPNRSLAPDQPPGG